MKNLLLIITAAILLPMYGNAQNTFAPVGAEWWYGGDNFSYSNWPGGLSITGNFTWTDHVQSTLDTTIDGQPCRKVIVTRMQKNNPSPDSVFLSGTKSLYFYDNTDTVFVFNEKANMFTPLYIFNTPIGDTVTLAAFDPADIDIDSFSYVMDSIKTESFGAQQLQSYYIHAFDTVAWRVSLNWGWGTDANQDLIFKGKFTKKIGGNWGNVGGLFPATSALCLDCGVSIGFPSGNLRCYSDSSISFNTSVITCDSVVTPYQTVGLSTLNKLSDNIITYPNPAGEAIHIRHQTAFAKNSSCYLQDCTGKRITSVIEMSSKETINIPTSSLANGIYILVLQQEGQRFYKKVVVHH
jgi:hypothetical protein